MLVWVQMIRARRLYDQADITRGARLCAGHVGLRALLVMSFTAVSVFVAGCGGGSASPGDPDGGNGGADASVDQRIVDGVVNVQPPTCQNARAICRGNEVLACAGGKASEVVETCPEACSLGRCTTVACLEVEQGGTVVPANAVRGCRFYGAKVDNIDQDDPKSTMLLISNQSARSARVRVEVSEPGASWAALRDVTIEPKATARVELVRPVDQLGLTVGAAFRVESDTPVMVVAIVSDDADRSSTSSGGTVVRPLQALGFRHLALTAPARNSPEVARTLGSRAGAGAITVVGTAADTHVSLKVTAVATVMEGGTLQPRPPEDPTSDEFVLNDGDVLQIFSVDSTGDLTGSAIESDTPVAVLSGNVFTSYGYPVIGGNGADLTMEQVPPVVSWGREYAGVQLSPSAGCESFFEKRASVEGGGLAWRVLAARSTTISLYPAEGATIEIPGMPPGTTRFALGENKAQAFHVGGTRADFLLSADDPVLLAQWMDCEPSLSWGIDLRLGRGDLAFGLPPGFDTDMVVVRETNKTVVLDGAELPAGAFRPLSPNSTLEAARVDAQRLRCADQAERCEHRLSGAAFGVTWRGMDVVCGYALTVPSPDPCSLPNVLGCPD